MCAGLEKSHLTKQQATKKGSFFPRLFLSLLVWSKTHFPKGIGLTSSVLDVYFSVFCVPVDKAKSEPCNDVAAYYLSLSCGSCMVRMWLIYSWLNEFSVLLRFLAEFPIQFLNITSPTVRAFSVAGPSRSREAAHYLSAETVPVCVAFSTNH